MIALSRLYLGVHFPHDVLMGIVVGLILLWLVLHFWKPVAARVKTINSRQRLLFSILASLLLTLLPLIPLVWLKSIGWQPPQEWAAYASQALSIQDIFTFGGTLLGLLAGLVWLDSRGGFQTKGSARQLVLRFLLGAAGVLILRYGLKFIFPDGETTLGYIFRYVRYTAIGFWVTGGAPWGFIRLKLAQKIEKTNITVPLRLDAGTPVSDI